LSGITKSIDRNGRLVVPIDMLKVIGIDRGDQVNVELGTDSIGRTALFISKYHTTCQLCGQALQAGRTVQVRETRICEGCADIISKGVVD